MGKINLNEIAVLKSKIDVEIEQGNYQRVDELTSQLCEMQGLESKHSMPEDFSFRIRKQCQNERRMKMKKQIAKVAILVCALGVSGGTVYAAVSHFQNVSFHKYGFVAGDEMNLADNDSSMGLMTDLPLEEEDIVNVISSEKGITDDIWLSKEVRQQITPIMTSDDGKNWQEGEPDVVDVTEYTYADYEAACQDSGLKQLFSNAYEQAGTVTYTEYISDDEIVENENGEITAKFKYGTGSFTVHEQKILNWEGAQRVTGVITSTEPTFNQREYMAASGEIYQLSDDTENGEVRTTVFASWNEYDVCIMFTGLSDEQIHEILDSITF